MFQIFEKVVLAKIVFSGVGGRVGLNFVKQTLYMLNPILFTIVVKTEVLNKL